LANFNRQEIEDLYRRFAPLVHARARRIVGDDANDIVQEVFEKLIRKPPDPNKVKTWIYRTATHACIDRVRYKQRRDTDWQNELKDSIIKTNISSGISRDEISSVEDSLVNKDLCRRLLPLLDKKTQQVVVLTVFDEMNQDEASEILQISRKTVSERLKKFRDIAGKIIKRWEK